MKLQQIKYIFEVARNQLNVSATAEKLFTSQPGISKQVRQLEDELGVNIFVRSGKHLTNVTPAGREILVIAEDILKQVRKIQSISAGYVNSKEGGLKFAPLHLFSRYRMPQILEGYRQKYKNVSLQLLETDDNNVNAYLDEGKLDLALVHKGNPIFENKIQLPCFYWKRCLIVPKAHLLAQKTKAISFNTLAQHPLLIQLNGTEGDDLVVRQFKSSGFSPEIVCEVNDCDVIKSYVRMGMGVGIIAEMSFDEYLDTDLVKIPLDGLFEPSLVNLVFDKSFYFREYVYDFVAEFAPHLTKELIRAAQNVKHGEPTDNLLKPNLIPTF